MATALYSTKILVPLLLAQLQFAMFTVAKETDKQPEKPILKRVVTPFPEDALLWENVTAKQENFLVVEDFMIINISNSSIRSRRFSPSNFSSDPSNNLTVYIKNNSASFLNNVSTNSSEVYNKEFINEEKAQWEKNEKTELFLNMLVVKQTIDPSVTFSDRARSFVRSIPHWDKAMFTPEQYQMSVCRKTCINGEPAKLYTFKCRTIDCYNCICDRPRCEIYGICCPEDPTGLVFPELYEKKKKEEGEEEEILGAAIELNQYPHINDQDTRNNNPDKDHETKSQLGPETNSSVVESARILKCSSNFESYIFVQSCPSDFNDSQIKKLCEEDHQPGADTTLDLIARAVDIETNVLYYNKYCAQCNGVFTVSGNFLTHSKVSETFFQM
ncbi:hypothetical protein PoB_006472200 [Plakobranchus ocellatus]|uniref:SMB domain-containing protein n=1 Tax=Plakobranchus ocellatus TaxID=259542 RepID=A0AAV4D225_9GAST|nr:hypothetical protein PoB_006472200 [Plakobranchus ocellatus]